MPIPPITTQLSDPRRARRSPLSAVACVAMLGAVFLQGCGGGSDAPASPVVPPPVVVVPPTGPGPETPVDNYPLVPTPTVTAMSADAAGSPGRNYPFFAFDFDVKQLGYTETEFFMEGKGNTYDMANPGGIGASATPTATGKVVTSDNPYKTRIYVLRPSSPEKFNGTVIVEFMNVTNNYDTPVQLFQQKDFLLRRGYAYIGVSAQSGGITNAATGLKAWSPARYGSLDVTNGGKITGDSLSYDIFAQAAKAARALPEVLGGAKVKKVIGIGNSQSAGRIGVYFNSVHPVAPIYDAGLFVVGGPKMRTDLSVPLIKVLSESELDSSGVSEIAALQPDTDKFVTWQVTSSSHSEIYGQAVRAAMLQRDLGLAASDNCDTQPSRTRVPYRYVFNAAIVQLEKAVDTGGKLPTAAPLQLIDPTKVGVARDSLGNGIGGIRLGEVAAPVARSVGANSTSACTRNGTYVPFDKNTLDNLYTSHDDYVGKYAAATNAAVTAGYLLPDDAALSLAEAKGSVYGKGLNCDGPLCVDKFQFANTTSVSMLRRLAQAYPLADLDPMLATLDKARDQIATGYVWADPAVARIYFRSASSVVSEFRAQVQVQRDKKALTTAAADYLDAYALRLITELGKL